MLPQTSLPTFTVTKDHLTLLRQAWVIWYDYESGAPGIDDKRPYGDSDIERDVIEALPERFPLPGGHDFDEDGIPLEVYDAAHAFHRETETVLQIALATLSFEPGTYRQCDKYDSTTWERVDVARTK